MERDIAHEIVWHSGILQYASGASGMTEVPADDSLQNSEGGPFLLCAFREGEARSYAVSDADAEEFIARVLARSREDGERKDALPENGEARATVRVGRKLYPFRDASLLKDWLEELRLKCGEPLSPAEFHRYTHPAPVSPEGAVEAVKIVEQAVLPHRPPAVLGPGPDNCRSELLVEEDMAVLSVFRDGMHLEYLLPPALLPEVNAAARELLDHPADGYHSEWDADAWLKVKGREEEFDADPEEVLKLFESLVGRCGDPIPRYERMDFYKVYIPGIRKRLAGAWTCPLCGGERNTGKYCETCSARREDIPADRAKSEPRPKADVPWSCPGCGASGNPGAYCGGCGSPYSREKHFPTGVVGPIGYRRGAGRGMAGGFGAFWPVQTPPPPKPKQAAPAAAGEWYCPMCGARNSGRFCTECGKPKEDR
jgi:hypothetical protein